jgi:hypothetical protein
MHMILPYLTAGSLLMLGWYAMSLLRDRGSRGAREAAAGATRAARGRTIYRNTPMADVGFDTRGIP